MISPEQIKLCVFDFDGTLVDSMGAFADLAGKLMEEVHGVPFDEARRNYLDTSGVPFYQQLEILFTGDPRNPGVVERFEKGKLEGFFAEPYFADVPDALGQIQASGRKVAVSSNNFQENVEEFVAGHAVPFDHVLGFRPGFEKGKDHFQYLIDQEGILPESILFVGDSLKDGERAQGAGVSFAGRIGTFTKAQFQAKFPNSPVLSTLKDLVVWLKL